MNTPTFAPSHSRPRLAPGTLIAGGAAALVTLLSKVSTMLWVAARIVVLYVCATR